MDSREFVDFDNENALMSTTARRFSDLNFNTQFKNLTKRQRMSTQADIESIIISHNEKWAFVIM